jgi:hypothetical protein
MSATNPRSTGSLGGASGGKSGTPPSPGKTQARSAIEQTEQKASQATERVAERAQSAFERTRSMVSDQVRSVASAIDRATDHLRQDDQSGLARRAEQVSRQAQKVSEYLNTRSAADLLSDLERVARERPTLFLGSAFLLGLLSARFLKSSERSGDGSSLRSRPRDAATSGYGVRNPGADFPRGTPEVVYGAP